ncbi:MAG: RidA family protein [Chloroflexota bacterium]
MEKTIINPEALAPPRGFNHGILTTGGSLLFLAGQDAGDAEGNIVGPGDIVAQFEQILRNFKAVVEEAGGTMQDIVKLNIFVCDREDYIAKRRELGKVHRAYFGNYYPTMALLEISALYQAEAVIELEGIAVIDQ